MVHTGKRKPHRGCHYLSFSLAGALRLAWCNCLKEKARAREKGEMMGEVNVKKKESRQTLIGQRPLRELEEQNYWVAKPVGLHEN